MTTKIRLLHDTVGIPTGAVAVTQSASDNTTKVATTAYVTTALAALADSAPSTLNTLNELAAALGDDASFSTTVTNSIATKLPLAGGTLTGDVQAPGVYIGSTNTSYDLYNNGTSYLNGSVVVDDNLTSNKYTMAGGSQIGQDYAYLKSNSTTTASLTLRKDSTGADSIDFLQLRSDGNGVIGKIEGDGDITFKNATFSGTMSVGAINDITLSTGGIAGNNAANFALNTPHSVRINIDSNNSATGESFIVGNNQTAVNQSNVLFKVEENGNVGIGTTSPDHLLEIETTSSSVAPKLGFRNTQAGAQIGMPANVNALVFTTGDNERMRIDSGGHASFTLGTNAMGTFNDAIGEVGTGTFALQVSNSAGSALKPLGFRAEDIRFATGSEERMRINTSGDMLIGKIEDGTSNAGHVLFGAGAAYHIRAGGFTNYFNRTSSDGEILRFAKDGTLTGAVSTWGGNITVGRLNCALKFNDDNNRIYPASVASNATRDNAVDLGDPSHRFNDIWIGGGIHLGGTGTVNKLDDYEFGGWTPALVTSGGVTTSSISYYSMYTKIGRICHIHAKITATLSSLPGQTVAISGLPFPAKDSSDSQQRAIIAIGGDTQNTGGNTPKAHFRTNGSQLQGIYWNASNNTAYWAYNAWDSTSFEIHVHGTYVVD